MKHTQLIKVLKTLFKNQDIEIEERTGLSSDYLRFSLTIPRDCKQGFQFKFIQGMNVHTIYQEQDCTKLFGNIRECDYEGLLNILNLTFILKEMEIITFSTYDLEEKKGDKLTDKLLDVSEGMAKEIEDLKSDNSKMLENHVDDMQKVINRERFLSKQNRELKQEVETKFERILELSGDNIKLKEQYYEFKDKSKYWERNYKHKRIENIRLRLRINPRKINKIMRENLQNKLEELTK